MAVPVSERTAERNAMVEQQLRGRGIRDHRVLEAMAAVPRHAFVREADQEHAYEDRPLPIGHGQTISQPYMVAFMMEALELRGGERVLEVGAGSGYQAAVLAQLAVHVDTVEREPELAGAAQARLSELGLGDVVRVIVGDGSLGYPEGAPYNAIVVAAAAPSVPPAYMEQLAEGGRLVIPVGGLDYQEVRQIRKIGGQAVTRTLGHCRFVPLTGARGWRLN